VAVGGLPRIRTILSLASKTVFCGDKRCIHVLLLVPAEPLSQYMTMQNMPETILDKSSFIATRWSDRSCIKNYHYPQHVWQVWASMLQFEAVSCHVELNWQLSLCSTLASTQSHLRPGLNVCAELAGALLLQDDRHAARSSKLSTSMNNDS
jgi:hypothetical protein